MLLPTELPITESSLSQFLLPLTGLGGRCEDAFEVFGYLLAYTLLLAPIFILVPFPQPAFLCLNDRLRFRLRLGFELESNGKSALIIFV